MQRLHRNLVLGLGLFLGLGASFANANVRAPPAGARCVRKVVAWH